ncbi:hypothetical protein M0Q97_06800 [Candidatus Dojkabacteria bacterium]|jgi:hypothetical protein|nr:hypothetical protein [Candidatus Dojkabacteria bacterium]
MSKEQFNELSEDVIEFFNELEKNLSFPTDLKILFQSDAKQKTLLKIIKIPDRYSVLLKADLIVSFNEEYFDSFDDEAKTILIDQELALLEFNYEKGTLKIGKPNIMTSNSIFDKYGNDAVKRANQMIILLKDQLEEKEKEQKEQKPKKNKRY